MLGYGVLILGRYTVMGMIGSDQAILRVIHRVGELAPEEPIVLVAVASLHRGEAFHACEFIIDYLKTRSPFWKKEKTAAGERWVDARHSDTEAEDRWKDCVC